jgi:hypothetical protein
MIGMPQGNERYEDELIEAVLSREVMEAVDALPDEDRELLLNWLARCKGKRAPKPTKRIQRILETLREKLGVNLSSESC